MYIPQCVHPFNCQWTFIWVIYTLRLLWIILLWTWMDKYLFEFLFSVLLSLYLGVKLVNHMVILCLIFEELPNCYPQWLNCFTFPAAKFEGSNFSKSSPTLAILFFFNVTLLVGVKHYLNVVLWMEEPGGLQSMGSLRVGHDWATSLSLFTFMHWRRKWQPTPVFLPGESQGRGSLVGCHLWGLTESDMTEAT